MFTPSIGKKKSMLINPREQRIQQFLFYPTYLWCDRLLAENNWEEKIKSFLLFLLFLQKDLYLDNPQLTDDWVQKFTLELAI